MPPAEPRSIRRHRRPDRRWAVLVCVILTIAAVAFIGIHRGARTAAAGASGPSAGPVVPASTSAGALGGSVVGSGAAAQPTPTLQAPVEASPATKVPAVPVRVRIPKIGVDSRLEPLGLLKDGTLESPDEWQVAGYYAGGPRPGQVGPAVIAGHVDSYLGPAIFYRLPELSRGDTALVTTGSGQVLKFVVTRLDSYAKTHFPTELVYGPTPLPELRLITCTGQFDAVHRSYLNNLVVSLVLAGDELG